MSGRSSGSTDARWTFQRPLQRLDRRVLDAPAAAPAAPPEMEAAAPGEGLRECGLGEDYAADAAPGEGLWKAHAHAVRYQTLARHSQDTNRHYSDTARHDSDTKRH